MPTANLLRKLGIYVVEDFMSTSECEALCKEMSDAEKTRGATYNRTHDAERVDHHIRKTDYCAISDKSHIEITNRIKGIRPALETFFNLQLAHTFEYPKYLHYGEGDFFSPHTDDQLNRKINITISLNTSDTHRGYQGGKLQLYGLINKDEFKNRGIAAPSSVGCLIAYPVDIVHEVTPITYGSRFCIVSRFLGEH